jgi:hypothetical protein
MPLAQDTGNFLINLIKGLGRQAIGKPLGVGQKFAGQIAGVSPEEMEKRRQELMQKSGLAKLLGTVSKAGSLTPEEIEDPLIVPKAYAGQAAFAAPVGKAAEGASVLQKALTLGKSGIAPGALTGFGGSEEGSEVVSTAGGGALGFLTAGALSLLGSFGSKLEKTRLNKKQPTITGAQLKSNPSFTSTKEQMIKTADDLGIRNTMRANDKVELASRGIDDAQTQIVDLLEGSKPVKPDTVLDNFVENFNNSALDDTKPGVKRLINTILNKLDEAKGSNIKLNELKTLARKEMGNIFSKDSSGTDKQETWNAIYRAIKTSLDDVSPDVRTLNNQQKIMFDLVDEFVPAAKKGTQQVAINPPLLTGANVPTGITREGFQLGAQKVGSALTAPIRGGSRIIEEISKINLPQTIKNALISQVVNSGGEQPEANQDITQAIDPTVDPTQIDRSTLSPEKQRALDIIDNAEAQSLGQSQDQISITGYSVEKLGQAYSKALQAGDTKAASKLKAMLTLESDFQDKNTKATGKQLPAGNLATLAETNTAVGLLPTLQASFDESKGVFGPVAGARGFNPYDEKAQKAKSTITLVKQIIGKGLEGGVLRKEDEKKYENILPKLTDTPKTVQDKINLLNTTLNQKYQTTVETFKAGGYDPLSGQQTQTNPNDILSILQAGGLSI